MISDLISASKHAFKGDSVMLPLEELESIVILVDADDYRATECVKEILRFIVEVQQKSIREKGVPAKPRLELRYLCSSKTKEMPYVRQILPCGCSDTFSWKNFNLCGGMKHKYLRSLMMSDPQAAFINLSHRQDYIVKCYNRIIPARFKIGLYHDPAFTLTIEGYDCLQCIKTIFNIMKMVRNNNQI